MVRGQYNIPLALAFGIGMFIGGWFGTKHVIKIGNEIFRNLLLISIFLFAVYFIYSAYTHY